MMNQSAKTHPRLKRCQLRYFKTFPKWNVLKYLNWNILSLGCVFALSIHHQVTNHKMAVLFITVLLLRFLLKLRFPTSNSDFAVEGIYA